jgi:hypothetical protein
MIKYSMLVVELKTIFDEEVNVCKTYPCQSLIAPPDALSKMGHAPAPLYKKLSPKVHLPGAARVVGLETCFPEIPPLPLRIMK